ncbi:MAG: hypothetical protein IKY95_05240 [Bacteroidales bacterium]|nr:hypothetical protein [Bacteroidales bacterium]
MKNFFSAVILAISTSLSISAQDINGVELYDEMTHAEVLEMFGEPTKYEEYDDQYEGFSRWYYYGENYLHFRDDVLEEFAIFDSSYTTLEEYFERGLRVGDPFSRLDGFKHGRVEQIVRGMSYRLYVGMNDNYLTLEVSAGIIVSISSFILC